MAVKSSVIRKNPATRLMIVREWLNRAFTAWTAAHGAWTRDKMFSEMEKELKERRRSGGYAGAATPLSVRISGRCKARKKGGE